MTDQRDPGGVSRRIFLQSAGGGLIAATALGIAGAKAQDAVGRPMPELMMDPPIELGRRVGYAVVGLGEYALNQILPAFGECRYSRLVALVSGDREKAERVATQYGVDHDAIYDYENYDDIADNDEIDIVYIITPPGLHADQSIRASRAGKHVMCEKPMAIDAAECQAMIEAAREADRLLMIGYRAHYEGHNREAIRMIAEGELGRVRTVSTENSTRIDPSSPSGEWRIDAELAGRGGALWDVGIYGVNGARYLLGEEPVEVRAMSYTPSEGFGDVVDAVGWQMRFASGTIVSGSTSFAVNANRFGVAGEEAHLDFQPATSYYEHNLNVRDEDGVRQVSVPHEPIQFALQLDHMSRAVLDGGEVDTPGQEGLQDIRIMTAILEAADTGRPVAIDWEYGEAG